MMYNEINIYVFNIGVEGYSMALSESKIRRIEEEFNNERLIQYERKRSFFGGLPFSFTKYYLTEKRLVIKQGFFSSHEEEILLYRILDTSIKVSLWQKIIRTGSIKLITSDKSQPEMVVKNIKNMRVFKNGLTKHVEEERIRIRFRTGEYVDMDDGNDCDCWGT